MQHRKHCDLWQDLSKQLHDFLSGISLQNLVDRQEVRAVAERQDKYQQERNSKGSDRVPLSEIN